MLRNETVTNSFSEWVNCLAHLTQLGTKKISNQFEAQIKDIRAVAKECKKVKYIDLMKDVPKPKTDIEPRWDTVYLMIEYFYDNKKKFQKIKNGPLALKNSSWSFIDEYYNSFKPIHEAMIQFQSAKYCMSESFNNTNPYMY